MNTRKIIAVSATFIVSILAAQAQEGPGGVGTARGLKMWLRADDPTKLTLAQEGVSNYTASPRYTIAWDGLLPANVNPSATQTVVDEWRSSVGSTVYNNTPTNTNRRKPVYLAQHYMMNYHPALDFYCNWSNFSTFLSTTNAPMSVGKPANSSTFLVMSADVKAGYSGDDQDSYFIYWHNATTMNGYTSGLPMFGIRNNAGSGQPRLRVNSSVNITSKGFDPGSTTIAEYQLTVPSNGTIAIGGINVGYNMNYVSNTGTQSTSGTWYMNGNGSLGGSLYHSRAYKGMMSEVVQYEGALTAAEQDAISSYFAIKYGITLRPSGTGRSIPRFDYHFSDNTSLWAGASGGGRWTTFYNNLAAVIRDDNAYLLNNQAHSTDIESMVHLGVAGTELYFDGNPAGIGTLANDKEAVVVGNNSEAGVVSVQREECGSFEHLFLRKWLVNKVSQGDRPVTMLIAAQNNLNNGLSEGISMQVASMYQMLVSGNDFYLIVADSPDKLNPSNAAFGDFKAVVPMTYRNGEHQCSYTFTDKETYFTFGYTPNLRGCEGEVQFSGTKTLDWSQWTRANAGSTFSNNINSVTTLTRTTALGDGISAKATVTYPAGVRTNQYYPSVTTSPRGSLDLMRRYGSSASVVAVTIDFTKSNNTATPVTPEFFISGLDAQSRQYDKVEVIGYCGGNAFLPEMTYAGNPQNASYVITGANLATVNKNNSQSATSANGRVNVAFKSGVDRVEVRYTLANRASSTVQRVYISPISIRQVPPPAVLNEDGLSFVKDVKASNITTCEEVEYTFYIENVNTASKFVKFTDLLPAGLKWHTLTLDSINSSAAHNKRGEDIGNYSIRINQFERNSLMDIDNLLIPCASIIKLTATAKLDDDAVTQSEGQKLFNNRATLNYTRTVNNVDISATLLSVDRMTLNDLTSFTATWEQKQDSVIVIATASPASYLANSEIEITLKVRNKNATPITNMYLNVDWDAGFSYVSGSYTGLGQIVTPDDPLDPMLSIAGNTTGNSGFTLPAGVTELKFKLRAPIAANLEPEFNEDGVQVNKTATLHLGYEFTTEQDDPCTEQSLQNNLGEIRVPYKVNKSIVTNKHITPKIKK